MSGEGQTPAGERHTAAAGAVFRVLRAHHAPGSEIAQQQLAGEIADAVLAQVTPPAAAEELLAKLDTAVADAQALARQAQSMGGRADNPSDLALTSIAISLGSALGFVAELAREEMAK